MGVMFQYFITNVNSKIKQCLQVATVFVASIISVALSGILYFQQRRMFQIMEDFSLFFETVFTSS